MSTLAPGIASNCLQYFVHTDENGAPIMGTMFSKQNKFTKDKGLGCREAILPATQMIAPVGHIQCFFPDDLHYYYLVDKQTGRIVPNSIWQQKRKVSTYCRGHYNILEYKIWQ